MNQDIIEKVAEAIYNSNASDLIIVDWDGDVAKCEAGKSYKLSFSLLNETGCLWDKEVYEDHIAKARDAIQAYTGDEVIPDQDAQPQVSSETLDNATWADVRSAIDTLGDDAENGIGADIKARAHSVINMLDAMNLPASTIHNHGSGSVVLFWTVFGVSLHVTICANSIAMLASNSEQILFRERLYFDKATSDQPVPSEPQPNTVDDEAQPQVGAEVDALLKELSAAQGGPNCAYGINLIKRLEAALSKPAQVGGEPDHIADAGKMVPMSWPPKCGKAGEISLPKIGLDYFYNPDDWEYTQNSDDDYCIADWLSESGIDVMAVQTLKSGPLLYAANIPTEWDEDGDITGSEITYFDSEEDAKAALATATTTPPVTTGEE